MIKHAIAVNILYQLVDTIPLLKCGESDKQSELAF